MNKYAILFLLFIAMCSGCVQFKTMSLYEVEAKEPKPPRPDDISKLVATEIFHDDTLNVWGIMNEPGKEARLTKDIKKDGTTGIFISWDRSKSEWTGFGAGWDDWAGKDLSDIYDYAAVQFYVRTEKGKMFGLPMVLSFEDYSEKNAYAYTANKYFERYSIDEEWQKVVVPLTAFNLNEFGLDISNIKQLKVELQGSGSLYLDEFKLVPYEPIIQKPWMVEEVLPNPNEMPKILFDDAFINENGFGIMEYACQKIKLISHDTHSGSHAISATWDNSLASCRSIEFGLSWNKWKPFDITSIWEKAAIEFYIKTPKAGMDKIGLSIAMQDYGFKTAATALEKQFVVGENFSGEWQRVVFPLSALKGDWNPKDTKALLFKMTGKGSVLIDDIRLISITKM